MEELDEGGTGVGCDVEAGEGKSENRSFSSVDLNKSSSRTLALRVDNPSLAVLSFLVDAKPS